MAKIGDATTEDFKDFQEKLRETVSELGSFEEAAQHYTTAMYGTFKDSIVLVRLFATVPYEQLPKQNQAFVDGLASSKGVGKSIHDQTLVLSLLGTSGEMRTWNDPKDSQGHVGIPLVSAAFIDAIPMMSRLLKQLGLGLDWIDSDDTDLVKHTIGSMTGVFFVPDATSEVDHQRRKIIAAQDFVKAHKVKTVFGFGGGYLGTSTFAVTIMFLRDAIDETKARQFAAGMAFFKAITADLVKKRIFG